MRVRAPNHDVYRVGRRWLPWRRHRHDPEWSLDAVDLDIGDDLGGLVLGIVLSVLVALLAPIVLVFLLTGAELVLLVAVLPFAVAGRVLLGRHWTVEVRRRRALVHEETAGSWTQSGKHIAGIAAEIRRGRIPA